MYLEEEVLILIIDARLTELQYMLIRLNAKHGNANIYPSHSKIIESKARCYPKNKSVLTTEKNSEVKL
jgi:hypothetical protein